MAIKKVEISTKKTPKVQKPKKSNFGQLKVGAHCLGQITHINQMDLRISLPNQLTGLVSINEISDELSEILSLNPKKVNSSIVKSDLSKGMILSASVKSIEDHGYVLSTGFNNINTFLNNKNSQSYIKKFKNGNQLTIGQVLIVSIINVAENGRTVNVTADIETISKDKKFEQIKTDKLISNKKSTYAMDVDLNEVKIGELSNGEIIQISQDSITISLQPSQIRASLRNGHLSDHLTPSHLSNMIKCLKKGDVLNDLLIISKNEEKRFVTVSHKPLLIEAAKKSQLPSSIEELLIGNVYPGYVKSITDYAVFVGFLGSLSAKAMRHKVAENFISSPIGIFYPNQSVLCLVTSIDLENSRCEVSLKPSETPIKSCPYISEVDFIKSYFSDILPKKNQKKDLINQKVKIGDIIKCKIKQFSELEFGGGWVVDVMLDGNNDNDNDKTIKGIINEEQAKTRSDLKKGDEIYGMVIDYDINEDIKKLANKIATETSIEAYIELVKEDYVVISLPEYENSLAFASTKSYNYRSTPFMKFKFGQKATAQIFYLPNNKENINNDGQLIDRALAVLQLQTEERLSSINNNNYYKTLNNFHKGQIIKGEVTGVEKYGIFIKINNSLVGGLCHISKLSDDFVKDVNKLYKIGDKVKAVVLEIDHEKQKISFGCRKSCFEGIEDGDSCEDDVPDYVESDDVEKHQIDSQESSNSEDDLSMSEKKKKKRKKKKLEIVEDLTLDLLKQRPEVNADYERLLLGSPNSSYLWINYMAHQLKLSEIEKAREIGERALKTINFREEEEKFNIWIALLNLENNFGTSVSMSEVLKRALLSCDPKELYMTLVDIYEKSDKEELTEQTYQLMRKKFSQSSKVWVKIGLYYLQHGKLEALHDLIQKCVKILPKYKHVKTLSKFAQMEFKHGEAERGRTIFEGMMNSYPKRVDLWSIYIDMEVKAGDQNIIRSVSKEKASTFECLAEKTNRPEYYEKGTVRSECFSNLEEKIIENTEREKKENTSEKECIICTEKVIIRDFMKVAEQCDHEDNMCQNCICEYITLELLKKGNINVLCPEYGCHSVLQEPDIKRFASAEAFERCDGIRVESCATRRPLLKPWIKKFQKSLLSRKAKKTEDEQKRRSIREAKEIEKEKNKLLKAERQSEAFIQSNTKECPKCKSKIQKDGGCDHMTCGQPCGYEFCWM
ncbi:11289_t:CDS:10 [Entrophospora sp. SA101]|nr:11367_t:CDS:10 [Entrophospora sp. SA101]CAJ0836244.1 6656_t:CDS:10 [Entrophospora sp. SA101]CAJ0906097.1 11289_t:CDS:10 [Entrophospora sp. SA101]